MAFPPPPPPPPQAIHVLIPLKQVEDVGAPVPSSLGGTSPETRSAFWGMISCAGRSCEKSNEPRPYTPEEKVAILRRHLLDKEPISNLCDELGLQPTVFYRWQKEFFENGAAASRAPAGTEPWEVWATHSERT